VWNANRGAISLRATIRGKAAHVGCQFEGVNAFERAIPAMARLLDIKKEVELRETQYNIAPAAARHSILLLGGRVEAGNEFQCDARVLFLNNRPAHQSRRRPRRGKTPIARCARRVRSRDASARTRSGDACARSTRRNSVASRSKSDR